MTDKILFINKINLFSNPIDVFNIKLYSHISYEISKFSKFVDVYVLCGSYIEFINFSNKHVHKNIRYIYVNSDLKISGCCTHFFDVIIIGEDWKIKLKDSKEIIQSIKIQKSCGVLNLIYLETIDDLFFKISF